MLNKFNLYIIVQSFLLAISSFIASSGILNNPYDLIIFSINIINILYLLVLVFGGEFIIFLLLFRNDSMDFNNVVFSIIYNCIFLSILSAFADIYIIWCISYIFQQVMAILLITKRNRE